jgi:hypothetical protein
LPADSFDRRDRRTFACRFRRTVMSDRDLLGVVLGTVATLMFLTGIALAI